MRTWLPLLLLAACTPAADDGGDTDAPSIDDNLGVVETEGQPACDNLDGDGHCLLPFPSDHWRDATSGRLALDPAAMPVTAGGVQLSTDTFTQDGFGVSSPILFQLEGATLDGVAPLFDAAASLGDDARTVLVDATTGARIPHWLEHDWLEGDATVPIVVIRAAVPLPSGARVVVGVRGLVDAGGAVVDAPEGFRALRDQEASVRKGVHARRAHYEADVFPVLEAAGFARADLQLAWDFTVRTDADATRDLTAVTTGLYDALGDGAPAYTIDHVQVVEGDASLALIVDATAQIPSFLVEEDALGIRVLRRDASGKPVTQGFESVPFRIQVPPSVLDGGDPAPVVQYGHGFLGDMGEANNGWLRELAQRHRFVILSADMQGMSGANTGPWSQVLLGDAGHMSRMAEEPMQGIANHLALQRLMKLDMASGDVPDELLDDGHPVWDGDRIWYHGNSQGGTMGTLVVATSRDVVRGALGVPGCDFPFLLNRSVDFVDWVEVLRLGFDEPGDLTLLLGLLGTAWDHLDGLTWAPHVHDDPIPGTPPHAVILHVGLEDAQVMNQDSWVLARALGAVQPAGDARPIWGIEPTTLPLTLSAEGDLGAVVVNFDFGVAPDPTPEDPPVKATDQHSSPRRLHEAQDQWVRFVDVGEVVDVCDGGDCAFPQP